MDRFLTVSELAHAITDRRDARDHDLLVRRIRHWTLAGVLLPVGPVHGGTGRRRRYPAATIHIAAVVNVLADRGFPIGVLKSVAGLLPDVVADDPDQAELWAMAIGGKEPVLMSMLHYYAEDRDPSQQIVAVVLGTIDETVNGLLVGEGADIIHLTHVFRDLNT